MGGLTGYLMAAQRRSSWEQEGRKRRRDEEDNRNWRAQQYWQAEVRRIMEGSAAGQARGSGQQGKQRRWGRGQREQQQQRHQRAREQPAAAAEHPRGGWRVMDDHALLGLRQTPPPTTADLASAYRREAMRWHPDHNQGLPAAELENCEERFKRLNEAYGRLRREGRAGARAG
eukprot:6145920-Prymnesium_polylepis.1